MQAAGGAPVTPAAQTTTPARRLSPVFAAVALAAYAADVITKLIAVSAAVDLARADEGVAAAQLDKGTRDLLSGVAQAYYGLLAAKRKAHAQEKPPSLRSLRPDVPPALDGIVARLLAKAPADRFPDAQAVAQALQPLAVHSDLSSLLTGEPRRSARLPRRRRHRILLAAFLVLALAPAVWSEVLGAA